MLLGQCFRFAMKAPMIGFIWAGSLMSANAQFYQADIQENIESKAGLGSMVIYDLFQDHKGFMWITTGAGIARFDGTAFKHYSREEFTSGAASRVRILEDRQGLLWVFKRKMVSGAGESATMAIQISFFNPEQNAVHTFREGPGAFAPFREEEISTIKSTDNREIVVGLKNGRIYYFDKEWSLLFAGISRERITDVALKRRGESFWLVERDTLRHIAPNGEQLEKEALPDHFSRLLDLRFDRAGGLWLIGVYPTLSGTIFFKTPGRPMRPYHPGFDLDLSRYLNVMFDREGRAWFMGEKGLQVFEEGRGEVFETPSEGLIQSFPLLFFDRDNSAWVSDRRGLKIVRLKKKRFQTCLEEEGASVRGIAATGQGKLWACTDKGVFEMDADLRQVVPIKPGFTVGYGLLYRHPYCWMGAYSSTLWQFDPHTGKREEWYARFEDGTSVAGLYLLRPFFDRRGRLWVGAGAGLALADMEQQHLVIEQRFNQMGLAGKEVRHLFENDEGLWVCTDGGLYLLDPDTGVKAYFRNFPVVQLNYLHESPDGLFWLATKGGGLLRWDRKKNTIRQFSTAEGLPNENVHAVYEDKYGRFWLPTDHGLACFNPQTLAVSSYFKQDGIAHNEFNNASHWQAPDGSIYLGGLAGITRFHPDDFPANDRSHVPLRVTQYAVWDPQTGELRDMSEAFFAKNQIELSAAVRSFRVQFALLDFSRPETNRYAYKLEGLDNNWAPIEENYVRFNRLPYGKYTLKVRGSSADGLWSVHELAIPIVVHPPVYLRWWFIALSVLAVLAFAYGAVRWRLKSLHQAKVLLEKEVAARTAEIIEDRRVISAQKTELETINQTKDRLMAVIGHELRGPMISLQNIGENISYLLRNGQSDTAVKLAHQVREKVFSVRMLLDNMLYWGLSHEGKQEAHPETVPLQALLVEVIELIDFWAASKKLILHVDSAPDTSIETDRSLLRIVVLNLVTNAIKFTPGGGRIHIGTGISADGASAFIRVSDSGIGMDAAQLENVRRKHFFSSSGTGGEKGSGMGLQLCEMLLRKLRGTMNIESVPNRGSIFTVILPVTLKNLHTEWKK
jgi:signal transduction histidine kinase/streptogramin lyase